MQNRIWLLDSSYEAKKIEIGFGNMETPVKPSSVLFLSMSQEFISAGKVWLCYSLNMIKLLNQPKYPCQKTGFQGVSFIKDWIEYHFSGEYTGYRTEDTP